jgi:hypothetical protein
VVDVAAIGCGKGVKEKRRRDVKVSIIILFLQSCSFSYTSSDLNLGCFPVTYDTSGCSLLLKQLIRSQLLISLNFKDRNSRC